MRVGTKEIKEVCKWDSEEIRSLCIRQRYYTRGNIESYSSMLEFVRENEPTLENMYWVAVDIVDHSDDFMIDVEHVMFLISHEVVGRFYEIA